MNDAIKTKQLPAQKWSMIVGAGLTVLAVIFLMVIVIVSLFTGKEIPDSTRFLIVAIFSISIGAGAAFITGSAHISGKQIIPGVKEPVTAGLTGGVAVIAIFMILGYFLYSKDGLSVERLATAEAKKQEIISEPTPDLPPSDAAAISRINAVPARYFDTETALKEIENTVTRIAAATGDKEIDGVSAKTLLSEDLGFSNSLKGALATPLNKAFDKKIPISSMSQAKTIEDLVEIVKSAPNQ